MKPCPKRHDPRPEYVRALVGGRFGLMAVLLDIPDTLLAAYASQEGQERIPYATQWRLEKIVGISAVRRARAQAGAP